MVDNPGGIRWQDRSPAYNDSLLNPFGRKDYPVKSQQVDMGNGMGTESLMWVSECCTAPPIGELDMSSVLFGGPSGFCSRCYDNCIFIVEEET